MAFSHLLVVYATLRPGVQWLGPVVTSFETPRQELWLTIDDGPAGDTESLLDLLDRHRVPATFFVQGVLVEARADLARQILARGHSLANHSQTHPSATFWCALPRTIHAEIDACNDVLRRITGTQPRWFRAVAGMKNPAVHPALRKRGMRLIGWTARGFDAVVSDPERVLSRILPRLRPGAILLLHQGRPHSLRVIEQVIVAAVERGYSFVIPVDAQLR